MFGMNEEGWILVGVQVVALIIWGARLETRVGNQDRELTHLRKRVHEIDEGGTRGMLVLVERQSSTMAAVSRIEERQDADSKHIDRRLDDIFKFIQGIKADIKNGHQ